MAATLDMPSLGKFYRRQLLEDVLPFWFPRAYDEKNGGLYHCFDADGTLVDSDKSVWAQGRMAWMLLTMYNSIEKNTDWLKWAESALEFLKTKCVDPADGRMFFHVAADGTPIPPLVRHLHGQLLHSRQNGSQIHRGTPYDRSGHPHDYPEHSSGNAQVPGR